MWKRVQARAGWARGRHSCGRGAPDAARSSRRQPGGSGITATTAPSAPAPTCAVTTAPRRACTGAIAHRTADDDAASASAPAPAPSPRVPSGEDAPSAATSPTWSAASGPAAPGAPSARGPAARLPGRAGPVASSPVPPDEPVELASAERASPSRPAPGDAPPPNRSTSTCANSECCSECTAQTRSPSPRFSARCAVL